MIHAFAFAGHFGLDQAWRLPAKDWDWGNHSKRRWDPPMAIAINQFSLEGSDWLTRSVWGSPESLLRSSITSMRTSHSLGWSSIRETNLLKKTRQSNQCKTLGLNVVPWWCHDDAMMIRWLCAGDALMMRSWCADDALMMCWWCAYDALMMRSWCTDDALMMHWWCGNDAMMMR